MEWLQVLEDKSLQDLPYKIELNEWGNIEMTPASNFHGMLQAAIMFKLKELMAGGQTFCECSVMTAKNIKVADVVWASDKFIGQHGHVTPYQVAPEICVEVVSPSNSQAEMALKRDLYLAKGAKEFWICSESGELSFHDVSGQLDASGLCLGFPNRVEV